MLAVFPFLLLASGPAASLLCAGAAAIGRKYDEHLKQVRARREAEAAERRWQYLRQETGLALQPARVRGVPEPAEQ